jgi:MerR family transcriptional regulator, light-induced transcriptional regulator
MAVRSKSDAAEPFRKSLLSVSPDRIEPLATPPADLLATIEAEIIPRLMLAHRTDPISPALCADSRLPPTTEEIYEFAKRAACHDLAGCLAFVETICREGASLEVVLLELVAPAARLLGEHWKLDLRTFTEVSAGLGTLQQVLHILGPSFAPALPHRGLVVLLAAPGEQHTLGLYLVGEFIRRAGWGVQIDPGMSKEDLVNLLRSERVEMVGFTVSNTQLVPALAPMIEAARAASLNPSLEIIVGGSIDLTEFAATHAVSLCASDARDAVRRLEQHAHT